MSDVVESVPVSVRQRRIMAELKRLDSLYPIDAEDRDERLGQIKRRLDALNAVTQDALCGLLEHRSRILESDRSLANLSSQCSNLHSSLARLQEGLSSYLRAQQTR
jgi:hypothetical protein